MIHRVYSGLPSFKSISFHSGLNVLLADKSEGASEKLTRNRAGKTSLIEVIHFVLGGSAGVKSLFRAKEVVDQEFGLEIDVIPSKRITAERSGKSHGKVLISPIDPESVPFSVSGLNAATITAAEWKSILGKYWFGLEGQGDDDEASTGPTFRSLFPYFVRRQADNAFNTPEKHTENQQLGNQQMALMYLLGLDWTIARDWHLVRERERTLRELAKAANAGALGKLIGTVPELRTQLAVAEAAAKQLHERLQSYHVLPEYEALEREASVLTREINELADANTLDRRLLVDLSESLRTEAPPPIEDLTALYSEVGVALPDAVLRRFEEVRAFHQSVVQNRKDYLGGEVTAAEQRIADRERRKSELDNRRAEILQVLRTHGALQQFAELQGEFNRRDSEVESLRQRFAAAQQFEGEKTELDIERNKLLLRLRQNFTEQTQRLGDAILAFEETSSRLYESAGSLKISESTNGPVFEFVIQGSRSKGIKNMQLFCFDMMLMRIAVKRGMGPGFLVHDSHLFDGVDGRQVAKALHVGAITAEELGFQYVVTMNSDDAFKERVEGFDLNSYVLPVRLTDASEDGGLFGIRFG